MTVHSDSSGLPKMRYTLHRINPYNPAIVVYGVTDTGLPVRTKNVQPISTGTGNAIRIHCNLRSHR